jgi:DNA-directed RNA polymerase subunit M/transcription elongation factor TFIIS
MSIKKIVLDYQNNFYCTYCGSLILPEEDWQEELNKCEHLEYIQLCDEIIYVSPKVREILEYEKEFDLNIINELTFKEKEYFFIRDNVNSLNITEYELESGTPSGLSVFIGLSN